METHRRIVLETEGIQGCKEYRGGKCEYLTDLHTSNTHNYPNKKKQGKQMQQESRLSLSLSFYFSFSKRNFVKNKYKNTLVYVLIISKKRYKHYGLTRGTERMGFEPMVHFRIRTLSKRVLSTTQASLLMPLTCSARAH